MSDETKKPRQPRETLSLKLTVEQSQRVRDLARIYGHPVSLVLEAVTQRADVTACLRSVHEGLRDARASEEAALLDQAPPTESADKDF